MKKTFLLAFLIFGLIYISEAQYLKESNKKYFKRPSNPVQCDSIFPQKDISFPLTKEKSTKNDINRVEIGKSANAFSILHSEQRPLFFLYEYSNPNLLSAHFTFTADPETYPNANSNGAVISAYSESVNNWDGYDFSFWEESLAANSDQAYFSDPSAVIINPENSTNLEDFYTIIAGPDSVNGSKTNFASTQLNNNNYHESSIIRESENDIARSNMSLVDNEVYIFGQNYDNMGDYGVNQTLKHYKGTTENPADGYIWEVNSVSPDWLIDPNDGFAYALYTTWSAWQKDGNIGYMWMIGVTNESYNYGVFQPQVYYTLDKGQNWQYIELNLEDNEVLQDYLPPWQDENGNPGTVRPSFLTGDQTYPGAVDYQGHLHLFSNVYGSTKGDVLNPDDSVWVNPEAKGGHIFDFIIDMNGLVNIEPVAELKSKVSTNVFGNLGFNHRLQVAKDPEEFIMAAIWLDDVFSSSDSLVNPSVFAWNICKGTMTVGPQNMTEGTLYDGFYFYPFLSEQVLFSYNEIHLPLTASIKPSEFGNNNPNSPITHYFVNGLSMYVDDFCPEGVSEHDKTNSFINISQNQPNPFSEETRILVSSKIQEPQATSIEVSDMLGHLVYFNEEGMLNSEMEIIVKSGNMKPGVYFYTVRVGEFAKTQKMIVE